MRTIKSITRRKIIEPLYLWTCRSPKLRYWKELEKTQFLSEEYLREIQWRRLKEILGFVWKSNSFYNKRFQEAGLTPEDIRHPEDLRRLPILTKSDIRNNTPAMISNGYDIEKLQKAKTGGSTGKALELYFTEECSQLRNACGRRHDRWTGWEPGEPIAACWGNPHLPKTIKEKLRHSLLQPIICLDTMNVNDTSVAAFIEGWQRIKPTLLFGHAHSLFILSQYLQNWNIESLRPKGIISTSMMLIPTERKLIETVFGIKVTDRYGCEEVSLIGCECEKHEGMHLNIEHLFIEFIMDDGTPAADGELGKIVVTDLMNRAMPLIRYQVEDMGMPTNRKCSCGRGLPLMESLAGRVADFLIKHDGTKVAGISLIENTLTKIPGIEQMQIVQEAIDTLQINLVPGKLYNSATEQELKNYFKTLFGLSTVIKINLFNLIKPEKSGKFRFTICKIQN